MSRNLPKCPTCRNLKYECECYDCHACEVSGEHDFCRDCSYAFCDAHLTEFNGKRFCAECLPAVALEAPKESCVATQVAA